MNIPKIVKTSQADLEKVKGVLTLGFSSDALLRWVFPDASYYLKCFDIWMGEFSKVAFKNNTVYSEENFFGSSLWHPPGVEFDSSVLAPTFDYIPAERIEVVIKFFEEFEGVFDVRSMQGNFNFEFSNWCANLKFETCT